MMSLLESLRLLLAVTLAIRFSAGQEPQQHEDFPLLNGYWWHPGKTASNDTHRNSCASYSSCNSCNDASWCHWCESDSACHAIGSIHGCIRGSDCSPPPPPKPPSNDSCAAHSNCADCTKHSGHLCHWCAHDNACHAIGSVYGCVAGVDCYSNDRCQRRESESLIPVNATRGGGWIDQVAMSVSDIGFFPLMVLLVLTLSCVCCVSLCFCVTSGVKGAYDDLLAVYENYRDDDGDDGYHREPHRATMRPLVSQRTSAPTVTTVTPTITEAANAAEQGTAPTTEYVQLGEGSDHSDEDDQAVENQGHIVTDGDDNERHMTTPLLVQRHRRPAPRHMQRMFNYCRLCYVLSLLTVFGCCIASILYFPKIPTYNVCNDAVAWGSLIDSITAMKATADFEILVSISNPNYFSLALDHGMGSFTHNGAFVGTYDIPPTVAAPMAITDVLMVAHLAPDKWDALGLVAEYYRGKLVLYVDAEATLRIPMLANYTFTTALKNIVVNVNQQSERHLCACPNWNEVRLGELGGDESAEEMSDMVDSFSLPVGESAVDVEKE